MLGPIDYRAFLLRVGAPEDEDEVLASLGKPSDDGIGEFLPSAFLMRPRLALLDGQCRVDE